MSLHVLDRVQTLPIALAEAWAFFSSPLNLCRITPPTLGFTVTCPAPDPMYAGQILTYTITPVPFMKWPRLRWVTEITHVREPRFFVDEQRLGPYRFWHHQHHFEEVEGGVRMRDIVHYELPLGPLGDLAHVLRVRAQLNHIFDFRRDTLAEMFKKP